MDINNARNWMCTVLNRKYYDLLREKYRKPLEFYGMDFDVAMEEVNNQATDVDEDGLTEEENLRRSVAHLTKLYREIVVRHYFHGQEVKKIADELSLPENTVKSRLRLGRDKLRKDLTMEKYEKQSFEPEDLWISSTGYTGLDDQPHSLVNNDKIAMNLLILAYEKPVTIPELSDAIGISTACSGRQKHNAKCMVIYKNFIMGYVNGVTKPSKIVLLIQISKIKNKGR